MSDFFIDLAVPSAVDRLFTYSVPPVLRPLAVPGARAVAPFGAITVAGIIVSTSTTTAVSGVREILDVPDDRPVITGDLMRLARWISSYYHAPMGEVLRSMLVSGFTGIGKSVVSPLVEVTPELLESLSGSPLQQRLLRRLGERGPQSAASLRTAAGSAAIHPALHELRRKGLVRVDEEPPFRRDRPKTETVIDVSAAHVARWLEWRASHAADGRKRKQDEIVAALCSMPPEPVPVPRFLRDGRFSPSALRTLARDGVVRLEDREVVRAGADGEGHDEELREVTLNGPQAAAVGAIVGAVRSREFAPFLLHGVTGSGKTQVYIEAIRETLGTGAGAIVLVPEISLTPQTVGRFRRAFGGLVAAFHSRMSRGERYDTWRLARDGRCSIVIGPRSAVFAPLPKLGLIVVDEEHEASYKQYDASPRYHARDAALVRGRLAGAPVVLGSATPSMESYANAAAGRYRLLELPGRADGAALPRVTIVDMAAERKAKFELHRAGRREAFRSDPAAAALAAGSFTHGSLSDLLRERIADRLRKREGTIVLQNRRGFSTWLECADCGRAETCVRCLITLTYHRSGAHLRCHYCGFTRKPPLFCGECGGTALRYHGAGTQRVEEELRAAFPGAAVERMDLDTTARRGSHAAILRRFAGGEVDILLGTQMIAKGLDIPRVTLVGVVSADVQLLLPDFRSAERTFQLLTQVAGRSGRRAVPGEVVVQTMQAEHPTMLHASRHDYRGFYEGELRFRSELGYPPFTRITLVEYAGAAEEEVRRAAAAGAAALAGHGGGGVAVLGPSPAAVARIRGRHRWHLVLKVPREADPAGDLLTPRLAALRSARRPRSVKLTIDADPQNMM